MNKSIKRQIATIFIGLVLAIMLISTFINSQFLERFYVFNKQKTLIDVYEKMEQAVKDTDSSYEGMAEELSGVTEAGNLTFVIMGNSQQLLASTSSKRQTEEMCAQLIGSIRQEENCSKRAKAIRFEVPEMWQAVRNILRCGGI